MGISLLLAAGLVGCGKKKDEPTWCEALKACEPVYFMDYYSNLAECQTSDRDYLRLIAYYYGGRCAARFAEANECHAATLADDCETDELDVELACYEELEAVEESCDFYYADYNYYEEPPGGAPEGSPPGSD